MRLRGKSISGLIESPRNSLSQPVLEHHASPRSGMQDGTPISTPWRILLPKLNVNWPSRLAGALKNANRLYCSYHFYITSLKVNGFRAGVHEFRIVHTTRFLNFLRNVSWAVGFLEECGKCVA